MADDMEKNRQQGGQPQTGQQGNQPGQHSQHGQGGQQSGQSGQNQQKKGGQNESENEDVNRQRRAS
jgi:hypothetical protein